MEKIFYVLFEGERGRRKPVSICPRAPRRGIKVRVALDQEAVLRRQVFLLYRRGDGDLVLGASGQRSRLEVFRGRLGRAADAYEIVALPILSSRAAGLDPFAMAGRAQAI